MSAPETSQKKTSQAGMSARKISAGIGRLSSAIEQYRDRLTSKLGPRGTLVAENVAVYSIAAAITWYVSRGISFDRFVAVLRTADLWLFVGANLASVGIWFCGEMYLYSKLFTFFHKPTTFRETLLTTAAQYFIQLINSFA